MPKMSSGRGSVATCIVDLCTSVGQNFYSCSVVLFGGELCGIHCREVDEFQGRFVCNGKKGSAAACWA
jgi:hypothetical protein